MLTRARPQVASLSGAPIPVPGAAEPRFLTVPARVWAPEDVLTLRIPLGGRLTAERVADSNRRSPLHALRYGPLVVAALTEGPRALGRGAVGDLTEPLPPPWRGQYASLGVAAAPPVSSGNATSTMLWLSRPLAGSGEGPASLAPLPPPRAAPPPSSPASPRVRAGGTDAAAAATWRIVPLRSTHGGVEHSVLLESLDRPGLFLTAPPDGAPDGAPPELRRGDGDGGGGDGGGGGGVAASAPPVPPRAEWLQRPAGGGGDERLVVLESAARPGAFITIGDNGSSLRVVKLWPPQSPPPGEPPAGAARFVMRPPQQGLPVVAFLARGRAGRRFLLLPLSDIVDETYSAYVEME